MTLEIHPIRTPVIAPGDDLAALLAASGEMRPDDVLVVSSKAAATAEGAGYDLSLLIPSPQALAFSRAWQIDAGFCEATILEAARMHGRIVGGCPGALLAEVRPDGMTHGTILAAYAGLDRSNVREGYAVGWPLDPVASVRRLHTALGCAVILTDSCCAIRRAGVTAYALAATGIDPLRDEIGKPDLFGRRLRMTKEAVADQLAVAANIVMGNAAQGCPAAVVRGHGLPSSSFEGWVPGIEPENDLFGGALPKAA